MNKDMKGFSTTWFEVCTVDGHALALRQGMNHFRSEQEAADAALEAAVTYGDTITVREHSATIKRVFRVETKVVESE